MKSARIPTFLLLLVLIFVSSCGEVSKKPKTSTPEDIKEELKKRGIFFSQKNFFKLVGQNKVEEVKLFLKAGMDVNVKGEYGSTALMNATSPLHSEVTRLLLDAGADVNATGAKGMTAMRFAIEQHNVALVKLFLERGAYVNVENEDGMSHIMAAAWRGHLDLVKIFLEKNATLYEWQLDRYFNSMHADDPRHAQIMDLLNDVFYNS